MIRTAGAKRPMLVALVLALAVPAMPVLAQGNAATTAEARLRKLEAEMSAIQRQVFPGGDGKYFPPTVAPARTGETVPGTPAASPVTDLLVRMDALEAQLARLTAQGEENANKLSQLEARVGAQTTAAPANPALASAALVGPPAAPAVAVSAAVAPAPATPAPAVAQTGATTSSNLAAMTGGASASRPATSVAAPAAAVAAPAAGAVAAAPAAKPALAPAAKPAATPAKPAAATPVAAKPVVAKPAAPSPARVAAVKAIEKPQTADAGDDDYSYGYRLWDAKFYPEAQQQLKLFLQKYPRHTRLSYARNLLGRAYLDEGNPREAASWFLQNYQAGKAGDRAPDSLLWLAESMRQLKDTNRACVALAQFVDDYPREAAGRLKGQYDDTRGKVKCN